MFENAILLLPSYGGMFDQHCLSLANANCEARHVFGAPIDQARCYLIEEALSGTDKDVFVFVDADISFTQQDLLQLVDDCTRTQAIVSGIYVAKNGNNKIIATTESGIQTEREDGLLQAKMVGMGFCAIHRNALRDIAMHMERVDLPRINSVMNLFPYFMPLIDNGIYLGEDYSFCVRARIAKVPIFLNSTILVTHWGVQGYKLQK